MFSLPRSASSRFTQRPWKPRNRRHTRMKPWDGVVRSRCREMLFSTQFSVVFPDLFPVRNPPKQGCFDHTDAPSPLQDTWFQVTRSPQITAAPAGGSRGRARVPCRPTCRSAMPRAQADGSPRAGAPRGERLPRTDVLTAAHRSGRHAIRLMPNMICHTPTRLSDHKDHGPPAGRSSARPRRPRRPPRTDQ